MRNNINLITIVTACYNESENIDTLYSRVLDTLQKNLNNLNYEFIFIDNASTDNTVDKIKQIIKKDKNVKLIVNSRNFGHIRSPFHAILQSKGDVTISLVADLQDPPEMIPQFLERWKEGNDIVLGIKKSSKENSLMFSIRKIYYRILAKLSDIEIYQNFTGFGLYDKRVIDSLKQMRDPYPFFRGMIAEVGLSVSQIQYDQPVRTRGLTKNNIYTLYDIGILGIINNSKIPLRLAIFLGGIFGVFSFLIGLVYLVTKLLYWDTMDIGVAPIIILTSFMFSALLLFIGILGEYVGAIYTQVLDRPLVFEKERVNFK